MAIDVILQKRITASVVEAGFSGALYPTDMNSIDALNDIAQDEQVRCVITRPRNLKHHRKFFKMIEIVYKQQSFYATEPDMLDDIKICVGHSRTFIGKDGAVRTVPLSISFAKMDQTAFEQFYNKFVKFILEQVLPGVDSKDLEQRVYDMLGEPGPAQLER